MIFFRTPHVTIFWDEPAKAVLADWHAGPPSSTEFRDALNRGIELLVQKGARHWLADTRKFAYPTPEDEAWSATDWLTRALAAGLERLAVIMPEDALNRIAVHARVTEIAQAGVITAYFGTLDGARAWLASARPATSPPLPGVNRGA